MADEATPTQSAPAAAEPNTNPSIESQPEAGKQPPWGAPENFDPETAWKTIQNLRKEKGQPDEALQRQVQQITEAQAAQTKRLAEALGYTEPPKNEDELTEKVNALQQKIESSEREANRLRIAAEKNIPAEYHDLLTETDPEKLSAQAEKVGALVAAQQSAAQPPAYQPNPGQGQGGQPSPDAAADAEYARYYPTPNGK